MVLVTVMVSFNFSVCAPIESDASVNTTGSQFLSENLVQTAISRDNDVQVNGNDTISTEINHDPTPTTSSVQNNDSNSDSTIQSRRKGRILNFEFSTVDNNTLPTLSGGSNDNFVPLQSRILTGMRTSIQELASNSFQDHSFYSGLSPKRESYGQTTSSVMYADMPVTHKYDAALINYQPEFHHNQQQQQQQPQQALKSIPPVERYSTFSYSNPIRKNGGDSGSVGYQSSDMYPYYHDRFSKVPGTYEPVMYQLVPVKPPSPHLTRPTISDAVKDTLFKFKESVTGTVDKVKNALGFHGFSEKVATPDALLAVAPVAAGLLAGGLAVAYFAARQTGRSNSTLPLNIFGKRSVRDVITEEDLNNIVARLDPVQREYLQKLQFYGPQKWKDVTCAKYIFCDVMSKATPLHVLDMQRKVGIFLSRFVSSLIIYCFLSFCG